MPDLSPYDLLLEDIVHGRLPDDVVELLAHAIVERLDRERTVMTPSARLFLDELIALCRRHQIQLVVDPMYECVNLRPLPRDAEPLDEVFWHDELEAVPPNAPHVPGGA